MTQSEERLRVLRLIESGQVSADEAARLLDALAEPREPVRGRGLARTLRVRITDLASGRQKANVTLPVTLIGVAIKLGARLLPRSSTAAIEDIQHMVEEGATGRIFEMQDFEQNERIEIFVEL